MARQEKTWVVVADGGRARILEPRSSDGRLEAALGQDMVSSRAPSREQWTDRPGRESRRGGVARHGMAPRTDPHEHEKTELARRVAEVLDEHAHAGRVDRIVLCAAPRVLGDIRDALSRQTRDKVVAELNKDLTQLSEHQLTQRLAEVLAQA